MKKKIIIGAIALLIVIVAIAIPKTTYQKWFNRNQIQQNDNVLTEFQRIYVVNDQNQLVGVKVYVESIEEDQITQKWNLLTANMNKIPSGFSSPITPSTILESYSIENRKLVLNVSEDISRSAGKLAVDCLAWTFCNDEIEEVVIKNDDVVINTINDYRFNKISIKNGANFTYETAYLYEASYTTIIYHENDIIRPVTYFYKNNIDECDYVIKKTLATINLNDENYEFELENNELVINLLNIDSLDQYTTKTIEDSVKLNLDIDGFTINGQNNVIYDKTFANPMD